MSSTRRLPWMYDGIVFSRITLADYPLSATVHSFNFTSGSSSGPVRDSSTGIITGNVETDSSENREEYQVGNIIYITSILRGCHHCEPLVLGRVYHARLGMHHGRQTLEYLQMPTKSGDFKTVVFEITVQRLSR